MAHLALANVAGMSLDTKREDHHLAAAEGLLALGDPERAASHRRAALDLCRRKGNLVAEAAVRQLLGSPGEA